MGTYEELRSHSLFGPHCALAVCDGGCPYVPIWIRFLRSILHSRYKFHCRRKYLPTCRSMDERGVLRESYCVPLSLVLPPYSSIGYFYSPQSIESVVEFKKLLAIDTIPPKGIIIIVIRLKLQREIFEYASSSSAATTTFACLSPALLCHFVMNAPAKFSTQLMTPDHGQSASLLFPASSSSNNITFVAHLLIRIIEPTNKRRR